MGPTIQGEPSCAQLENGTSGNAWIRQSIAWAVLPAGRRPGLSAPPLPETAFLVEAVRHHPVPAAHRLPPWWNVSGQVVRVLDLIEVLEERDAFRRSAPS